MQFTGFFMLLLQDPFEKRDPLRCRQPLQLAVVSSQCHNEVMSRVPRRERNRELWQVFWTVAVLSALVKYPFWMRCMFLQFFTAPAVLVIIDGARVFTVRQSAFAAAPWISRNFELLSCWHRRNQSSSRDDEKSVSARICIPGLCFSRFSVKTSFKTSLGGHKTLLHFH